MKKTHPPVKARILVPLDFFGWEKERTYSISWCWAYFNDVMMHAFVYADQEYGLFWIFYSWVHALPKNPDCHGWRIVFCRGIGKGS